MKLDLRKDFDDIYAHVVDRVRTFDLRKNAGPGKGKSVTMIDFGFQCDQDGWVCLVFDTRPDAEPDGEWNSYIEETLFPRPHWQQMGALDITLINGKNQKLVMPTQYQKYANILGDLLKSVFLKARADGVFKALPTAEECHMGVEEHDGAYGWPQYEDRGKEDLV
jgi:hypothetical protein